MKCQTQNHRQSNVRKTLGTILKSRWNAPVRKPAQKSPPVMRAATPPITPETVMRCNMASNVLPVIPNFPPPIPPASFENAAQHQNHFVHTHSCYLWSTIQGLDLYRIRNIVGFISKLLLSSLKCIIEKGGITNAYY